MSVAVVVRRRVYTSVGTFLAASSVTVAFLCMRSVMAVGGSCASGGPYQVNQECPSNMWLLFVAAIVGLAGAGLTAAGRLPGGASLTLLAWCALFLSMAWNFFEFGIDPPAPATGTQWGWIVCGVIFVVMGAFPLVYVVTNARQFFWGDDSLPSFTQTINDRVQRRAQGGRSSARVQQDDVSMAEAVRMANEMLSGLQGAADPASDGGNSDLAGSLERLAKLHAAGQLTDQEYAAAKAQLLDDGGTA